MRGFAVRPDSARPPCIFRRHLSFFIIVITLTAFNFIALHATFFCRVDSIMSTYCCESPVVAWTVHAPIVPYSRSAYRLPARLQLNSYHQQNMAPRQQNSLVYTALG